MVEHNTVIHSSFLAIIFCTDYCGLFVNCFCKDWFFAWTIVDCLWILFLHGCLWVLFCMDVCGLFELLFARIVVDCLWVFFYRDDCSLFVMFFYFCTDCWRLFVIYFISVFLIFFFFFVNLCKSSLISRVFRHQDCASIADEVSYYFLLWNCSYTSNNFLMNLFSYDRWLLFVLFLLFCNWFNEK